MLVKKNNNDFNNIMFIKKLLFHDNIIHNINIKENEFLISNSTDKIIYYNLNNKKVCKILYIKNIKYVENNNNIYSINNESTITKINTLGYKKISYLGHRITYIKTYNSNIYFSSENGYIYELKNGFLKKIISYTKFRLICFFIINSYIYAGYSDGYIIIFYNDKMKIIPPKNYVSSVKTITYYSNDIYCLFENGLIKIINNLTHTENINLFSDNIILKNCNNKLLIYSNSSINLLNNDNSIKIFQTNKRISDFYYNNDIIYISNNNKIFLLLYKL